MTGVRIEVVTPVDARVRSLRALDSSYVTDVVYRVDVSPNGFVLSRERVTPPLSERYDVLASCDGATPWDAVVLATSDEGLAGFAATTYAEWNRRQVLNELHVAPHVRRTGIARRLVAEVDSIGRRNAAREIWVETQNVNAPAIEVYLRLGFRLTGIDVTLYPSPSEGEVAVFLSKAF